MTLPSLKLKFSIRQAWMLYYLLHLVPGSGAMRQALRQTLEEPPDASD